MQKYVIALYIRLSIEDYKYDSMSIENQRLVLNEYAAALPEALNSEVLEFVDNGYSGTNFERPQVQKLIEMVRENKIDCIIVKDFSRFGRNSIETGYFLERVFPLFHTRFISVSDDYDSNNYKGDTGNLTKTEAGREHGGSSLGVTLIDDVCQSLTVNSHGNGLSHRDKSYFDIRPAASWRIWRSLS